MRTLEVAFDWLRLVAVFGVGFAFVAYAVDKLYQLHQRVVARAVELELRRVGVSMGQVVDWFHPLNIDQAATWSAIAEELASGRPPNIAHVRGDGVLHARAKLVQLWALPRKEASNA